MTEEYLSYMDPFCLSTTILDEAGAFGLDFNDPSLVARELVVGVAFQFSRCCLILLSLWVTRSRLYELDLSTARISVWEKSGNAAVRFARADSWPAREEEALLLLLDAGCVVLGLYVNLSRKVADGGGCNGFSGEDEGSCCSGLEGEDVSGTCTSLGS